MNGGSRLSDSSNCPVSKSESARLPIIITNYRADMGEVVRTISYLGFFAVVLSIALGLIMYFEGETESRIISMRNGTHNPFREFNQFINNLFYTATSLTFLQEYLVSKFGEEGGYFASTYFRDWIMGTAVYWITAGVWHIYIYNIKGNELFVKKGRPFPERSVIIDQMMLAQSSLFAYAGLPVLSEFLIEMKWTKTYFYLDEIGGWPYYVLYLVLYLAFVDYAIYWVHRSLHEYKFLYKYVHGLHHKYNKQSTLTPWSSIAFNPLDGLLQASPYVVFLFVFPVHYFTHVFLLFFTGVWATNIHDAMWGDTEPIMGSKYHTMHHTHYHYNFGQFFIYADKFHGTLKVPEKSKFD